MAIQEGFSDRFIGEIQRNIARKSRLMRVYGIELSGLCSKLDFGAVMIKSGHRVKGVAGSGREATDPIFVPLSDRQIEATIRRIDRLLVLTGRAA